MAHQQSDETVNRYVVAAAELLRHGLDPQFADDGASLVFLGGPPLDRSTADYWSISAKQTGVDIIYLAFEPGRERFGPTAIGIFSERAKEVTTCIRGKAPAQGLKLSGEAPRR